jgi:tRNA pseudouridine13 synthase
VWNKSVTERLRKYGMKVMVGDLVVQKDQAHLLENEDVEEIVEVEAVKDAVAVDNPYAKDDEEELNDEKDAQSKTKKSDLVIEVTEDNLSEYSIYDVVMPMVGPSVRMPSNPDVKKIILDILEQDGMSLSNFALLSTLDSVSASGSYRKILAKPEEVIYDITMMQFENEELLTPNYLSEADPTPRINEQNEQEEPITKAVRMRFNLKTSSYATMLLRELTRTSSAFSTQYNLSIQRKNQAK